MGVDTYAISKLEEPNLDAMFYFLGFIVSLLAGTIDFLYKEALHASHIVSEPLSRHRTAPALLRTKSQSRLRRSPPRPRPPACRTRTRAAQSLDIISRADRPRTQSTTRALPPPALHNEGHLRTMRTRGVRVHAANAAKSAARVGIRVWDGLGVG